jgi:hypothetical protein
MRRLPALFALVLATALLGGCGSSGDETTGGGSTAPAGAAAQACALNAAGVDGLRVTGVSCEEGQRLAAAWKRSPACPKSGSRGGCSFSSYRCQATATDRGWSVSCAKPGRSVAFTVRRG